MNGAKLPVSMGFIALRSGLAAAVCMAAIATALGADGLERLPAVESLPAALMSDTATWLEADACSAPGGGFEFDVAPEAVYDCQGSCYYPAWYVQADVVFLERTDADELFVAIESPEDALPRPLLSTDDLSTGFQPGMRLTLGRILGASSGIEISYLGLQYWKDQARTTTDGDPFEGPFGAGVVDQTVTSETEFHSAELNFRSFMQPRGRVSGALLCGVRYLRIADHLRVDQAIIIPPGPDGPAPTLFDGHTDNDLIGAQIGGELTWNMTRRLRVGATGKTGLFGNIADFDMNIVGNNLGQFVMADNSERLAGVIDASVSATFRATEHIAVRGGYQVIYVGGVALAPENFKLPAGLLGTFIQDNGDVVFDGPSAGIEVLW